MTAKTTVTIPTENLVSYTYDAAWSETGSITLNMTAARTSKGDETHIATVRSFTSGLGFQQTYLQTLCGLDHTGRVYHKVWGVAPSRITCEKCNGTKAKKSVQAFWSKLAAMFA